MHLIGKDCLALTVRDFPLSFFSPSKRRLIACVIGKYYFSENVIAHRRHVSVLTTIIRPCSLMTSAFLLLARMVLTCSAYDAHPMYRFLMSFRCRHLVKIRRIISLPFSPKPLLGIFRALQSPGLLLWAFTHSAHYGELIISKLNKLKTFFD